MEAIDILARNVETLVSREELEARLKTGKRLRIKFGVDPTRPDLTFGHMVVFNLMKRFQQLGHETILLLGDYTTLVGDPTGRSSTRPVLTREEIEQNAATYLEQAFKILDREKTIVRRNSEWFNPMGFDGALALTRIATVAQMLERNDFKERYEGGTPISIVEFLYPLLQGYDSVALEADVELGGADQLFNLHMGRHFQKAYGQTEQIIMTMPLLVGLDGVKKMSKSLGNYIAFNDSPKDMFGKIMSVSDTAMWEYYRLLLETPDSEIAEIKAGHPMVAKKRLARELVEKFYGRETAQLELEQFEKVFSQGELPDNMPEFAWTDVAAGAEEAAVVDLLGATKLVASKNEIRRLIEQGAVKINDVREQDVQAKLAKPRTASGYVIQAGKRLWVRVK